MQKISFNDHWKCWKTGLKSTTIDVDLPHDAMLLDERSEESEGGRSISWFDADDYTYEKTFWMDEDLKGEKIVFEFEGVYKNASVYINERKVLFHRYGYIGFYVEATKLLTYGAYNTVRVEVENSDQPNSRWYSGTGMIRPVWMLILKEKRIKLDSIRVTTLDIQETFLHIQAETNCPGKIRMEILDEEKVIYCSELEMDGLYQEEILLPDTQCWSPEDPKLYTCRLTFEEDVQEVRFGIRLVQLKEEEGLLLNGEKIILKGACIHHDNGILGACAYTFAERRKVKLLKEAGYNAIWSAHNPCSKALLDACDEFGMLLVDEYADMWYLPKTVFDYSENVETHYRKDLKKMVEKDYNHPSVIMYSVGNEITELATKKGLALCRKMASLIRKMDPYRFVTSGINFIYTFMTSVGAGPYSERKTELKTRFSNINGEVLYSVQGSIGEGVKKFGTRIAPENRYLKESANILDVVGYHYGVRRYRHDVAKYPKRMVLGSKSFTADAYQFWELAKQYPSIIGDFVWTGIDHLGDAGMGAWEYEEYAPKKDRGPGWISAGSGRLDLNGREYAEMAYTRVAFEMQEIGMGVVPVNHTRDSHSPSEWRMTNALESWSWNGCSGETATVEVYTRADHVSLFVNGRMVGTKTRKNDCRVVFHTTYEEGEVRAVAYDENHEPLTECTLTSGGDETMLSMEPEEKTLKQDELCYLHLRYTDKDGKIKPMQRGRIHLLVKNGKLLGFGSACPYYAESYLSETSDTYYGEALAIIKPEGNGPISVQAFCEYGKPVIEIPVENRDERG